MPRPRGGSENRFLHEALAGQSYFSVSWVLTWFSHNLADFENICRLFDFFLACHPLMSVYFSAAFILERRKELLLLDRDIASVHSYFQMFPANVDVDRLIQQTRYLFRKFPPSRVATAKVIQQIPLD